MLCNFLIDSCSHLVLEEANILLERFPCEMRTLLEAWSESHEKSVGQLIALADRWNPDFSLLCRTFKLAVVITNMMEAIVYSRFQVLPTFMSSPNEENDKMISQVKSAVANAKGNVVFCCSTSQVIPGISSTLASYHQVILKSTNVVELTRLWGWFKKTQSNGESGLTLFIITDPALAALTSTNIELPARDLTLIHWDLPTQGKKAFERRFCLLRSVIPNIHHKPENLACKTNVHLLLRPHDAESLYTIMDFLRRSNAKVPEELEVFHSGAMFGREKKRRLCSKLEQVRK